MKTHTGHFPIGFRQGWSQWQKNLTTLTGWAKQAGFEAIDLGRAGAEEMAALKAAGLRLGTADLLNFGGIMATDPGKRKENVAANVQYVKEAAAAGVKNFFTVVLPGDPAAKRADNYKLAVETYAPICEAAGAAGAFVVLEGWPGMDPAYAALCCSPETVRAFIKEVPCGTAVNYDPSHLIRLGIDHIRFLHEFLPHVKHVHGKDTELFPETQYELGLYQGSAFVDKFRFGENVWRYTIPGHGEARWNEIFKTLAGANYQGVISVELEDKNYNTGEEGEKTGLTRSLSFLSGV